jgi:hypothetical protein
LYLQILVCVRRGIVGCAARPGSWLVGIDSIGGSDGSRGCTLISGIHFLAEVGKLGKDIEVEFDNAMTRINALLQLSQVSRWQS